MSSDDFASQKFSIKSDNLHTTWTYRSLLILSLDSQILLNLFKDFILINSGWVGGGGGERERCLYF